MRRRRPSDPVRRRRPIDPVRLRWTQDAPRFRRGRPMVVADESLRRPRPAGDLLGHCPEAVQSPRVTSLDLAAGERKERASERVPTAGSKVEFRATALVSSISPPCVRSITRLGPTYRNPVWPVRTTPSHGPDNPFIRSVTPFTRPGLCFVRPGRQLADPEPQRSRSGRRLYEFRR